MQFIAPLRDSEHRPGAGSSELENDISGGTLCQQGSYPIPKTDSAVRILGFDPPTATARKFGVRTRKAAPGPDPPPEPVHHDRTGCSGGEFAASTWPDITRVRPRAPSAARQGSQRRTRMQDQTRKQIGLAIVGCGTIGRIRAKFRPGLSRRRLDRSLRREVRHRKALAEDVQGPTSTPPTSASSWPVRR